MVLVEENNRNMVVVVVGTVMWWYSWRETIGDVVAMLVEEGNDRNVMGVVTVVW